MSEVAYAAMREFIKVAVELEVGKRMADARATQSVEPRAAEPIVGPPGRDGIDGKNGVDGKDGKDGTNGERGPAGERGADGLAGRDGAPGQQGERGERGADGIATREEISALIEERFAELQTRTLADYHQRTFERGGHYKRGALVAWDGATWLAMTDTDVTPGTSPDWQMIAKKGRDGRDRK